MPKVSIIVPIYNAEKYLGEMLDSICVQSLEDFEVICVVDCPKDGSLDIVRDYARKDARIRVLENEHNIGAGESRNRGLKEAQAPYVCFFDADDIFDPSLLETAYRVIAEKNADIVLYEYDTFCKSGAWCDDSGKPMENYTDVFCLRDLSEEALSFWNCVPWNKMYRKAFIEQNQLEYQDLSSSNDVYFSDMSLLLAERIVHIGTDKKYVHYRVNTETQICANREPLNAWYAMKYLYEELKRRNKLADTKKYFYIKFFHTIIHELKRAKSAERAKEVYDLIHQQGGHAVGILELDENDFDNPYYAGEISKFLSEKYESRWFEQHIELLVRMKQCKGNMLKLYEEIEKNGGRIAVWGAGLGGHTVLKFFDKYSKRIPYVIDNDINKQGGVLEGRKIVSFESVASEIDVVFVSNSKYYAAIYQQVKRHREEIRVIDLNEYLDVS